MPFVFTSQSIALVIDGKRTIIHKDDPRYPVLRRALEDGVDERQVLKLAVHPMQRFMTALSQIPGVSLAGAVLKIGGAPVEGAEPFLLDYFKNGHDPSPIIAFVERLAHNQVAPHMVNQLLNLFFSHELSIDLQGLLVGFKVVNAVHRDLHGYSTLIYEEGSTVGMPRAECETGPDVDGPGLHFCSPAQVKKWYEPALEHRVMAVTCDAADLVAVSDTLGYRSCKLHVGVEVLAEDFSQKEALPYRGIPVLDPSGTALQVQVKMNGRWLDLMGTDTLRGARTKIERSAMNFDGDKERFRVLNQATGGIVTNWQHA